MENRRLGILAACILVIGASLLLIAFTVAKVLGSDSDGDFKRLESNYQKNIHENNHTIEELNSKIKALTGNLKTIKDQADQENNSMLLNQLSLNMSRIEAKMEEKWSNTSQELQEMIKREANARKTANEKLNNGMQQLKTLLSHYSYARATPEPEEQWNITYACQVYKDPELTELQSRIPEKISVIFSNDTKAIETRIWRRQLTIDNDQRLRATVFYNTTTDLKHWQFQAVDDACEHFIILHVEMNVALGVVNRTNSGPTNQYRKIDYQPLHEIHRDPRYHWKILLTEYSFVQQKYYQFINNDTGMALAANEDSDVFPCTSKCYGREKWELE